MSIDLINMQRAYISSICAVVAIPILGAIEVIAQWNTGWGLFLLCFCGIMEVIEAGYIVLIRSAMQRNHIRGYAGIYLSCYASTIAGMMVFAMCDMRAFGSQIFSVLTCLYLVFVPALKERVRWVFLIVQTAAVTAMMFVLHIEVRDGIDLLFMQVCMIFLIKYEHELVLRKQKMTSRLKEKTSSSEHDALTGLLNRRGLERRATAIWPYCQRNKINVGMIALDIDYFKKYNDAFGHPQGDACLRIVADTLKESAARCTDVVTRTGGEEFLIFIQDVNEEDLPALALKIRKNIAKKAIPHAYCMVSKNVTVSIGIASGVPGRGVTFKSLYENADKALYQAKKNGRNCIVYNGSLYGRIRGGIAQSIST